VVVAIIATFVYATLNALEPRVVLMGRVPGRLGFYKMHRSPEARPVEGMIICFIQGSVLFFNSDNVKDRLEEIIAEAPSGTRWLVIDASAVTQVDSTAAAMLQEIRSHLRSSGIQLAFAEVQSGVAALLARAGLSRADGTTLFFDDLEDAVQGFMSASPEMQPSATDRARAGLAAGTMEERP
jgi:anti-anti-sigma factor